MAKLRHVAPWTRQPEKMAEFYIRVFEMKEMFRTKMVRSIFPTAGVARP